MTAILKKVTMATALTLAFTTFSAQAQNTRPYVPPSGDLSALQSVFSGMGSSINVNTDQSGAAVFNPTGFGVSAGAYIANVTWATSVAPYEIGLYEYGDVTNKVTLFGPSAPLGSRVSITFTAGGDVFVNDADTFASIDTATGFGHTFGMYFDTTSWPSGGVYYTEDSQNGGNVQALVYEGNGNVVTVPTAGGPVSFNDVGHWYVGWEGLTNTGSGPFVEGGTDFNDAVVMMESITPVPEPETYAMLLAGLGLMGFVARRRQRKLATA